MHKCFSITKAVSLSKTSFPFSCWFGIKQNMKWNAYQDFCSALWNFCLRHRNFPLNTLYTSGPNSYRLSCFLASQILASHSHPLTACGGSFWIQNPAKTANVCTFQSLQAVVCPGSSYQSVEALHSANTVCLARRIMWPGNHSSQPRLSSLLAQKNIVMTSLPQPGPKSGSTEAENDSP